MMNKYLEKIAKFDKETRKRYDKHTETYRHNGYVAGSALGNLAYLAPKFSNELKGRHTGLRLLPWTLASLGGGIAGSVVGKHIGEKTFKPEMEKKAKFPSAQTAWTVGGAALGGLLSSRKKHSIIDSKNRPRTIEIHPTIRALNIVSGAATGALLGSGLGRIHSYSKGGRSYHGGGGGSGNTARSSRTIHDIKKDLDLPGHVKTKADAKKHFRSMASKHHPDKHEGPHKETATKKMQELNRAWDEFQSHPEGFTKLANTYLTKIAKIDWKKVHSVVKANPGAVIGAALGGAEGASSTTAKRGENPVRVGLRGLKNTAVGMAGGAAAGKFVQTAFEHVSK